MTTKHSYKILQGHLPNTKLKDLQLNKDNKDWFKEWEKLNIKDLKLNKPKFDQIPIIIRSIL